MERHFSLECLTVNEVSPLDHLNIARDLGYEYVSLVVQSPAPTLPVPALFSDSALREEFLSELARSGIRISALECFNLLPGTDVESFRPALELGARMGALSASTIVWENPDKAEVVRLYAALCRLAGEYGIRPSLEFMALSRSMSSLDAAHDIIERSGAENGGLTLDLLHIMRTGTTLEQIGDLDPLLVVHVQVCDGLIRAPADALEEAGESRLTPGEGEFPVREFLKVLPPESVIALEVPQSRLARSGVSAIKRARRLRQATVALLEG